MPNQFVNLPAPTGNGLGAAVDVSTFGAVKTIVVGGDARAIINVEFNNSVVSTNGSWQSVATFQNTGQLTVRAAARWMRVRVSGYNAHFGGAPVVDVGGTDIGTTFATLVAPAATGAGTAVDVSALGLFKTVQVGDQFRGTTIIEGSEDGTEWGTMFSFQTPGAQSGVFAAKWMRVRRVGVPVINPGLPLINIGATDDVSGDGGVAISAGSQSVDSGTVVFSNSNGVSFGMSGSSRVTASFDAIKSFVAGTQTGTGPTVIFSNSNGVSFGMASGTVTASVAAAAAASIAAGTQTAVPPTVIFSNSNNVSFGMSGSSQVTASASFPAETPFGISGGTQSVSTGTLVFSNSNNVSFGMSGSSRITASASFPAETPFGISAGTQSVSTGTLAFANSNGVSFGMAGSSQVTASVAALVSGSAITLPGFGGTTLNAGTAQSVSIVRVVVPYYLSATQAIMWDSVSGTSASQGGITLSLGVYTMSGSTASLASSGFRAFSWTSGSDTSASSVFGGASGLRARTIPIAFAFTPGDYLLAYLCSFSGVNVSHSIAGATVQGQSLAGTYDGAETALFMNGQLIGNTAAFPASFGPTDTAYNRTASPRSPFAAFYGTY